MASPAPLPPVKVQVHAVTWNKRCFGGGHYPLMRLITLPSNDKRLVYVTALHVPTKGDVSLVSVLEDYLTGIDEPASPGFYTNLPKEGSAHFKRIGFNHDWKEDDDDPYVLNENFLELGWEYRGDRFIIAIDHQGLLYDVPDDFANTWKSFMRSKKKPKDGNAMDTDEE